jgi:hypothetical protein
MDACILCGKPVHIFGNLCWTCQNRGPWQQFDTAMSLDLQRRTVDEMIDRFVIDIQQSKHYGDADPRESHFETQAGDRLDWREVHQLVIYCARKVLEVEKAARLSVPCTGYVRFDGLRARDRWHASTKGGFTDVVIVKLWARINSGFTGHGYPYAERVRALGNDEFVASGTIGEWRGEVLNAANNAMRIKENRA